MLWKSDLWAQPQVKCRRECLEGGGNTRPHDTQGERGGAKRKESSVPQRKKAPYNVVPEVSRRICCKFNIKRVSTAFSAV